ncbi:hypothetical protein HPB48_016752 [Haemaphysalis longicornis]|uniref:Uncharacterized protein n=1 Tax=Haemaphysalis longicornis TaxID=44386 RepID=A0A9J6FBH1_HAELO|nr:hypothetical protein HPB48_016752 [Haemaphysalis longicornis]
MKCSSVALGLTAAQLVAGVGMTVLSIHTMLKLPSLATRDCPLWAAGPVSRILLRFCAFYVKFLILATQYSYLKLGTWVNFEA